MNIMDTVTNLCFPTFILKIFDRMASPVTMFYISILTILSVSTGFSYGRSLTDEITIRQGTLVGLKVEFKSSLHLRPVEVYLGIPYAAAPTGSQRFMPPGSPPPWTGVKFANKHPAVCPQNPPDINEERKMMTMSEGRAKYLKRLLPYLVHNQQDEDCLYLNIFSPAQKRGLQKSKSKYPVIVFIHGESFEWNSGNPYDGSVLASYGEVVVVTVNFRLGILGFLRPGVGDNTLTNFGLLDQIAALQWVKENIEKFGGDSKCVTLMGHGTGAACVNYLMVSPVSRGVGGSGLFHRAILMSGTALADWALTTSNVFTIQVAQALNCPLKATNNEMTECLQKRRLDEIMAVKVEAPEFKTRFGPMVDGSVVPNDPFHVTGEYKDLFGRYELLYGVTEMESYNLLDAVSLHYGMLEQDRDKKIRSYVQERFEYLPDMYLAETLKAYTDVTRRSSESSSQSIAENNRNTLLDILSDARVVAPMVQTANFHSSANPKSYFYVFSHRNTYGDYESARIGKSVHGEELPYVFGVPLVNGNFPPYPFSKPEQGFPSHPHFTDTERLLSEAIITFWTNFAKTGNPNAPLLPRTGSLHETDWPEYESKNQLFLSLGIPPVTSHHYRSKMTTFWNIYLPEADKSSGYQDDDGCSETNATETGAEVGTTSSVAISIVVVVGLCLLLINLCACGGLYYQRERLRAQERVMKRLYGDMTSPANDVDLYIKRKDHGRANTKNVVFCDMAERSEGPKKKTTKQSMEQVYEAVRNAGHLTLREEEEEDLSFKRFELSRQCSASTIDPHTKVREWIASADLNQQFMHPYKRSNNQAFAVESTKANEEINVVPRNLITSPPKHPIKKVSVAIDANQMFVTQAIQKQVNKESSSKSMENLGGKCLSTSKIVLQTRPLALKRSETCKESLTKSSTSSEHLQPLRSITNANLNKNLPLSKQKFTNLPIIHKHSKSDPVSQTTKGTQQNVSYAFKPRRIDVSLDPKNGSLIPVSNKGNAIENSKTLTTKKNETKTRDNKNDNHITSASNNIKPINMTEDVIDSDFKKIGPLVDIKRKNYPKVLPTVSPKHLERDAKERVIASQHDPSTSLLNDESEIRQKSATTSRKQDHATTVEILSSKNTSGISDMKQSPKPPVETATSKSLEERLPNLTSKQNKQKVPSSPNPNIQRQLAKKLNSLQCQQCAILQISKATLAKSHKLVPIQTADASTETKSIQQIDLQETKDSKQTSTTLTIASEFTSPNSGTGKRAKQKTDVNLQTEEQIPVTSQFREDGGCVVCEMLQGHLNRN